MDDAEFMRQELAELQALKDKYGDAKGELVYLGIATPEEIDELGGLDG